MANSQRRKDSFLLYASQYEAINSLTNEQMGRLFHAVFQRLDGSIETLEDPDPQVTVAFKFLQLQIRKDKELYERRLEAERDRMRKYREKIKNEMKESDSEAYAVQAHDNDNENDNENENDNDNENDNERPAAEAGTQELTEQMMLNFVDYFNNHIQGTRIPRVEKLTDHRRELIQQLNRQYSREQIARAIYQATHSRFLNGENKRRFILTFDLFLQTNNFIKST